MNALVSQITKDAAYNTVSPTDFAALIEVDRYGTRSNAFDKIITATHDHFWDPLDPAYIDFSTPFDMENQALLPEHLTIELQSAVADKLNEKQKIQLINMNTHWSLSSILHGEQGAMSLSASLCHILVDPGAQEYAANQAREEGRHVTAFTRYIQARWGKPVQVGPILGNLLSELVLAEEVYKKLVGMQMLVEGLAMGAFAMLHANTTDPLLKRTTQLVMTDEAFHHKFGKIWADRTISKLSTDEHNKVEDWAFNCFQTLFFNLVSPDQKGWIYERLGLDPAWVQAAVMEAATDDVRRDRMKEGTDIFRVLIKTLLNAGIITDRTRWFYEQYVDMVQLKAEGDYMVGDAIAEEGIAYLREINKGRRQVNKVA
ncbi:ferritin-like domain-containing protein [Oleomonas cavernae]|uniref:Ferritin-like domain-containing protein n=1 Tax=Oleomonas cavernae TaxID=2320859 RepID=A0A418WGE1_9PROT|nr:ferritin-like domain-containing protein [Oleomonas cavernae]RJF89091.1 ferritin-like domain-containing protein [Oleomonas cavernae]